MTGKEFLNRVTNGKVDVLQLFFNLLSNLKIDYCLIGGMAVNVYAEPVVSLDLDVVVVLDAMKKLEQEAKKNGFRIKEFEHSVNLYHPQSDVIFQLQTDNRYQGFIAKARVQDILGYQVKVAALQDVLQGKIWAYLDKTRRPSKRQKDLADIFRLVENHPQLKKLLPPAIQC